MLEDAPTSSTDRRSARREATKAEILDAAWGLVREHGLGTLSLRDLAAKVGMRAPSLYQYFDSKHAIYDAMFGQAAQASLDAVSGEVPGGSTSEAIGTVAHRLFYFATSDAARAQLLFQRTIPGFEPSASSYAPALELVARNRRLFADHGIHGDEAFDLFRAVVGGLVNQQLANDPGGDHYGRLIDPAIEMFLAYVTPNRRGKK
jgi:AcrR family transcriptional regulator